MRVQKSWMGLLLSLTAALTACGGAAAEATPTATLEIVVGGGGASEEGGSQQPQQPAPPTDPATATPVAAPLEPAACLLGTWELDNQSYLEFLRAVSQTGDATGTWEAVTGRLLVTFDAQGQTVQETDDFAATLCAGADCITVGVAQSGAGTYSVEGDQLTTDGISTTTTSLAPNEEMTGAASAAARFLCQEDSLTVFALEGAPPVQYRRVPGG